MTAAATKLGYLARMLKLRAKMLIKIKLTHEHLNLRKLFMKHMAKTELVIHKQQCVCIVKECKIISRNFRNYQIWKTTSSA